MHTNVILTNKRRTHAQYNTKLKPGLGASYTIGPVNGVGLFYTGTPPDPQGGKRKMRHHKPVMPRDVDELVPPSADDYGNVEAEDKRQWNEVGKALAVDSNVLKHSAQQKPHYYISRNQ